MEYISRQGWELNIYNGLIIARKFGPDRKCIAEESAEKMRDLAYNLGWYP